MPRCRKKTELSLTDTLQAMRTQTGLRTGARSDATHLLLKREEMLSKVFRLIPDMVVVTELTTGTILDVNDRYCEVMGYRRDELIGSSSLALHNWVCPDDRKAFTDALLRNTTCSSFRTTLCTKSGTRMPVTITARLLDLDGTTCIVSIVRDITELHQKEQALEYRIALERLVATISTHVLGLRASDIDAGIEYGLERIGTFAGADRCTLWQCLPDGSRMDATHEWCAADVPSLLRRRSSIRLRDELPALMQCIQNSAPYRLDLPLPTDIGHDHDAAFFRSYRTVSVVAVPMPYPGQPTLVLCCEKTKDTACWPADLPALLKIASEIFMNALIRARNERELRDSEQRFRSLFDNAQDGMVVVDPETLRCMTVNCSIRRMLGYAREEMQTIGIGEMYPETIRSQIVEQYRRLKVGAVYHAEAVPLRRKDGTTFPADMTLSTVILDARPYILGVFRDMTAQLNTEAERLRLFMAVEQATEFISILGADGTFQYINPAGERMFGYSINEVVGKNAFTTDKGIYDAAFYQAIWKELRSGKAWSGRLTTRGRDGVVREIEQNISPVRDRDGNIVCFLSIGRDITNEVRLEQALRHAQKMEALGTLSSGIAHDFNNILSVITGYAQILLTTSAEHSPEETSLMEILHAARRARDLVRQILTFSRQTEQERKPLHIAPVIKETLRFLGSSLPASITIEHDIDTETDVILTDPTHIHQIIMNLCTNAIHAMKQTGGVLRVMLRPVELTPEDAVLMPDLVPGSYLMLTVSDTGHGIPADIIDRIFDPYFTTKPHGEGTGLGLSVVHGIVKQHGGAIRVHSTDGTGACFELWFPRHTDDVGATPEEHQPVQGGSGKILFVDDDPAVAKMGQEMLERLGYRVVAVTSSSAALEVFHAAPNRYDLLITDKTMPGMDGFELAAAARRIRPDLPIMVVTGFSDAEDPEKARTLGIQEMVMKPLLLPEIAAKIRRLLRIDTDPPPPQSGTETVSGEAHSSD